MKRQELSIFEQLLSVNTLGATQEPSHGEVKKRLSFIFLLIPLCVLLFALLLLVARCRLRHGNFRLAALALRY